MLEAGGEFGEKVCEGGAVGRGQPAEEGGFDGEQVGVGLVEGGAAGVSSTSTERRSRLAGRRRMSLRFSSW